MTEQVANPNSAGGIPIFIGGTLRGMNEEKDSWAADWLGGVAEGSKTMSQRKLSSVEARAGGLAKLRREARSRGVHLLMLTDDKGNDLVAASIHPFYVLC